MRVSITPQGQELYPKLLESWTDLVPVLHVPHAEFVVWEEVYRSWASEVFLTLAGDLDVESNTCLDIVAALKTIYATLPHALLEELVDTLIHNHLIEGVPSPKEHQIEWLDMVLADVFSHRTRMAILREVRHEPKNSPYLEATLGMPTMTVRFHLNKLVESQFLEEIYDGHNKEYALMVPLLCVFSRRWIRCIIEDRPWLPA